MQLKLGVKKVYPRVFEAEEVRTFLLQFSSNYPVVHRNERHVMQRLLRYIQQPNFNSWR